MKYKTIDKPVYSCAGVSEDITAYFIIEIAYIYDTHSKTPIAFCDAAVSDVYMTSTENCQFKNGGYTLKVEDQMIRISNTGQFEFSKESPIDSGTDLTQTENGYLTPVKTYVAKVQINELTD